MVSKPESELSLEEMHTSSSSTSSLVTDRSKRETVYFHGGIGGAGNYRRVPKVEDSDPTAPRSRQPRRLYLPRWHQNIFSSGIGGAGNMHTRGEEAALTEQEDEARARARDSHPPRRWFVGIGGVGNKRTRRQDSPSSDFSGTTSGTYSTEALPYGAADIMRRKMFGDRSGGK